MNRTLWTRSTAWISEEPIVLLAVFAVVASLWGFAELSDDLLEEETTHFDRAVLAMLRDSNDPQQAIGPSWLPEVARDITSLGGYTVLGLAVVAVGSFLWLCRAHKTALFLLVAAVAGVAICQIAKMAFARPRPDVVPHLAEVNSASFPSGHSMMSAVVYLTLAAIAAAVVESYRLKLYLLGVALVLTVLVGCSRVYLGVHYPTDVLAGWMLGLAWAFLCWIAARLLQRRGRIKELIDPT
jgi:undecaprenyl-diphosphatase